MSIYVQKLAINQELITKLKLECNEIYKTWGKNPSIDHIYITCDKTTSNDKFLKIYTHTHTHKYLDKK